MKSIVWIRLLVLSVLFFGTGAAGLYSDNGDQTDALVITAIESGELADLIAVNGGLEQGIERGMILSVFHDGKKVGELLVTRSQSNCAVALISEISPNQSLRIGDRALPKLRNL